VIQDTRPQQVLQGLNHPLRLAICLRMIGRTHPQPATHSLLQRLPEPRSEPGVSVRHYATGHPMKPHYLLNVELSQLGHRHLEIHCQKVSTIRQPIYHHPYSIMSSHGARQMGNKIHSYDIPLPHQNIQGLERPTGFLMLHLRLLTSQAGGYKLCNLFLHA